MLHFFINTLKYLLFLISKFTIDFLFAIQIQNDFGHWFPLTADNFLLKWDEVSKKILSYCDKVKRSVKELGIDLKTAECKIIYANLIYSSMVVYFNFVLGLYS
jgi:hypothetical protein